MTKVSPLYEGTFSVGIDKEFHSIGRDSSPNKGALKLSINPFLIQDESEKRNILFDAGIGDLLGHNSSIETILNNLENESVSDYEITDIFLSHLHFDHMGGLANRGNGYWELTFPDACLWVSEPAWKKLHSILDDLDSHSRDFFNYIDTHANIHFLKNVEEQPIPHIRIERIGGHTEYHNALFYENGKDKYLMAGDVIGTRGAINRTYAAKFDFDPKQSMKARKELQSTAKTKGHIIMAYHETHHPLFKLTGYDEKKGYNIENIKV